MPRWEPTDTMTPFSLNDLARAIEHVGDDLKRAAGDRAQVAAGRTVTRAQAVYPIGPVHVRRGRRVGGGVLRRSVGRGDRSRPQAAVARVTAPHVHFYEDGTEERFDATRGNAFRGRMPAKGPLFVGIAIDERADMVRDLTHLVTQDRELG